ncbi:MAG: SLC13 family permease, partial [Prevotella sp.]
ANYSSKTVLSTVIMVVMILLAALNLLPLLHSCFLAAFAMLLTKCCSIEQAERNINWKALMVFAGSICFGKAIEHTGLSEMLATWLLDICGPNPILVLTVICLVTTFATEFISNTATSAMFFPIAYDAAISLGCNPMMFCMGLMIAAASSFATPIGSPTHMLVYAPGGYRFVDFVRIGLPMNFVILIANIFIVTLLYM